MQLTDESGGSSATVANGGSASGVAGAAGDGTIDHPNAASGGSAGSDANVCEPGVGSTEHESIYGSASGTCGLQLLAPYVGTWFPFDDGTHAAPGSSVEGKAGGRDNAGCYVQGKGLGATNWGGGLGFSFSATSSPCPLDATAFSGLHLFLNGSTTATQGNNYLATPNLLRINLVTTATSATYGTCDPAQGQCEDHFGVWCPVSGSWTECDVPFSSVAQRGWGVVAKFDKTQLLQLQILAVRNPSAPTPTTWNVGVTDVAFVQ